MQRIRAYYKQQRFGKENTLNEGKRQRERAKTIGQRLDQILVKASLLAAGKASTVTPHLAHTKPGSAPPPVDQTNPDIRATVTRIEVLTKKLEEQVHHEAGTGEEPITPERLRKTDEWYQYIVEHYEGVNARDAADDLGVHHRTVERARVRHHRNPSTGTEIQDLDKAA